MRVEPKTRTRAEMKEGFLSSNGRYRRVYVGVAHPMADAAGIAYEHRVVMAEKLGRKLASHEHVHHINGDGLDNRPENLMILPQGEHNHRHAKATDQEIGELILAGHSSRELWARGIGTQQIRRVREALGYPRSLKGIPHWSRRERLQVARRVLEARRAT